MKRKRPFGSLALTSLACAAIACGDDGTHHDTEHHHDSEHTTGDPTAGGPTTDEPTAGPSTGEPSTAGTSTGEPTTTGTDSTTAADSTGEASEVDVEIQFAVRVGDEDATCGVPYEGIGAAGTTIELLDLRFFVSNVRLLDAEGTEHPLTLTDDGEWQLEGSALLDFEDATGGCSENTTAVTNTSLRGTILEGEHTGIRFDVGLPFEQNHLNADEAPPPLNTTAMFWSWAAGYKFAKIDVQNDLPAPGNRWNFHLGSQGCDNGMAGPTVPPDAECSRPGRPAIELTGFDPLSGTVVLDLAALFDGVDLTADTPMTAPGCMSFMPDVNECTALFPNLGLSWETGDCDNGCADQIAFTAQ